MTECNWAIFFDKQNIVCAMMPPPFSRDEVDTIGAEELWDKSGIRSLKQNLNKDTVKLLLESDADYLVLDFYDMGISFGTYDATCFATQANEFCNTSLYKKYQNQIAFGNLFDMPSCLWYGYIDLFMEKILPKYDADHIILNRFRCNSFYFDKKGKVGVIPPKFQMNCQPNPQYVSDTEKLEKYFIHKYNPWVIDLSKYFMGDNTYWNNLNGAHFEKEFYREIFDQIKRIVFHKTTIRYYDEPDFFNPDRREYEEDIKRPFDVEFGLTIFQYFLEKNDILWLNILDKLNIYAPNDERVVELVNWMNDNNHE